MVRQGIVLSHEILRRGIEVDKAKIKVTAKLPVPKYVRDIHSFLGHAGFYQQFMKNFIKITRPLLTCLLKMCPLTSTMSVFAHGKD